MRQLLQKICCFWQAGSLQKYPPPPGVADINLNSPGKLADALAAVARLGPYRRRRAHDGSVEISEHAFSERLLRARTRSAACCAPVPCNLKMIVLFRALTHPQTHRLTGHPHRTAGRTPPAARGALAPGPAPGRGRGAGPQPLTPCAPRRAVTRRER